MAPPTFDLPPFLANIASAAVTAVVGAVLGRRKGREEGRAEFLTAVQEAAELVIDELKGTAQRLAAQHDECERNLAEVRAQIDVIMSGKIPPYHLNAIKGDS